MDAIRCQGLTKRFGSFLAVDGLDLSVAPGAVFGFLGPNGAGKTTTIRMLTGVASPTAGRAWVAGQEVLRDSLPLREKIGFLPEEPVFYNWMTGRELLTYVGELFGLAPEELRQRREELLVMAGLRGAAHRPLGGYSRGMRQRLGDAQALMNRPQVLFLDEPCSSLDPLRRREVLEFIAGLRGRATVFLSTHILSDVERVCARVAIINRGKLVVEGPVEELRRRFGTSVYEVEVEDDGAALSITLEAIPWVARAEYISTNGHSLVRVWPSDYEMARRELPRTLIEAGVALHRYEMVIPALEEVFVELVEGER